MDVKIKYRFIILISLFLIACMGSFRTIAEEYNAEDIPARKGVSLISGRIYDPGNDIDFFMMSGFLLFDYDKVWKHKAPESLRFKVEGSLGVAREDKTRLVTSVNMFALHYLDLFESQRFKPYIEGGIGIIYTDFQVRGQGLRFNFNPQIGIGTEIQTGSHNAFFLAFRLHHISNAGLNDQNRGLNSVMCMLGYLF